MGMEEIKSINKELANRTKEIKIGEVREVKRLITRVRDINNQYKTQQSNICKLYPNENQKKTRDEQLSQAKENFCTVINSHLQNVNKYTRDFRFSQYSSKTSSAKMKEEMKNFAKAHKGNGNYDSVVSVLTNTANLFSKFQLIDTSGNNVTVEMQNQIIKTKNHLADWNDAMKKINQLKTEIKEIANQIDFS